MIAERIDKMHEVASMMTGEHPGGFLCWIAMQKHRTILGCWDCDNNEPRIFETEIPFERILEKFPLSLVEVVLTPKQRRCKILEELKGVRKVAVNIERVECVELLPNDVMEIDACGYTICARTFI